MKFTWEQDEVLIDLVRLYPVLYSVKSKGYKDNEAKGNAWKIIAAKMDKNEVDCRSRWKNIKDYYQRKKKDVKKGTGSAADGDNFYEKFKPLRFLENTAFVERSSKSNILPILSSPNSDILDDSTEHGINENNETQFSEQLQSTQSSEQLVSSQKSQSAEIENENLTEPASCIPERAPRNSETVNNVETPMTQPIRRKRSRPGGDSYIEEIKRGRSERTELFKSLFSKNDLNLKGDPAINLFFNSIAVTVGEFTPEMKAKAKVEVMTLISRLELENMQQISQQQQQQQQQAYMYYAHGDSSDSLPQDRYTFTNLDSPGTTGDSMAYSPPCNDNE